MNKTFWPNNKYYISFSLLLACFLYVVLAVQLEHPIFSDIPLGLFVSFGALTYFYLHRITIEGDYIKGPSAYVRFRRTKIPKNEVEAFYVPRKLGTGYLILRHKFSNMQIFVRSVYFSDKTLNEIKSLFPAKIKE